MAINVLIIDDDPLVRDDVGYIVAELGATPLYAGNGAEALDIYRGSAKSVKLIICDTRLDVSSEVGYEVYDSLKNEGYVGRALGRSGGSQVTVGARGTPTCLINPELFKSVENVEEEWRKRGADYQDKGTSNSDLKRKIKELLF